MKLDSLQDIAQSVILHCVAFCAVLGLIGGNNLGSILYFQALQGCEQNQVGLQGQEAFVTVFLDGLLQQLGDLAVAGAADNVLVLAGNCVLDVDVGNFLVRLF